MRAKRTPRSNPKIEVLEFDEAAWCGLGRKLRELEPDKYRRLIAIAHGLLAVREPELESTAMFLARCADMDGRRGAA